VNSFFRRFLIITLFCSIGAVSTTFSEEFDRNKTYKIAVKPLVPFIIKEGDTYSGFTILLWNKIAEQLDIDFEYYDVKATDQLIDEVVSRRADLAFGGLVISSDRVEKTFFSQPYFSSGQHIMILRSKNDGLQSVTSNLSSIIFSPQIIEALFFLVALMFISANLVWFFERKMNRDMFPHSYVSGVFEAFWWSAVTVTTVGYGDKTPKSRIGRGFALIWMFTGIFLISFFTATVSSTLTLSKIKGDINSVDDLAGKQVGTTRGSLIAPYLKRKGVRVFEYPNIEKAYLGVKKGLLTAVVYESSVLKYFVTNIDNGRFKIVGNEFKNKYYGMAIGQNPGLQHHINIELLKLQENGVYDRLYRLWFGDAAQ
jgi:polar amino acid transport system substrate-binding protein